MFRRRVAVFLSLLATKWNSFDLVTFEEEGSVRVVVGVDVADGLRGLVLDDEVVKLRVESMSGHEESSVMD